jgi:hypothetical protein
MTPNKESCGFCTSYDKDGLNCKIGREPNLTGWCASFANKHIIKMEGRYAA